MISAVLTPVRSLVNMLRSHDSPYQLAGGFTIGSLIGLVPVANLIGVGLCVLLGSLRVNKAAGVLGATAFMWVGTLTDPLAHAVGARVLSYASLQPMYSQLYDMPLGPWIGFNNTVVLGSLLLGIYFSYPVFWISFAASHWGKKQIAERARRRDVRRLAAQMKLGAKWGRAA